MAIDVAVLAQVVSVGFEEVEDVEGVSDGLAVEQNVTGELGDGLADGLGQGDGQSPSVDAGDVVSLPADQEAASVVLLLKAMAGGCGKVDGPPWRGLAP